MPFHADPKSIHYTPLLTDPEREERKNELASPSSCNKAHIVSLTARELVTYVGAWGLATVALIITVAIWLQSSSRLQDLAIQKGEYAPAKDAISVEQVLFVASATFNRSESPPRKFRKDGPLYVGDPSPDIDKAWDELLDDQYFYITDKEAKSAWGDGYEKYWRDDMLGGYRAGLDVFHTLHCLNTLRKEIHKEYYRDHPFHGLKADLQRYHIDHCIDVIRQAIQCSADLTPIPVVWFDSVSGRQTIDSERVHTCRDIHKIREWTTQQVEKSKSPGRGDI